ncbi:MAG: M24 family metallopeptidase [Betaproteobacteria bacterium]
MVAPVHEELVEKHERVAAFLANHGLDGVVLATQANVAWYTGGADIHVGLDKPTGSCVLVVEGERVTALVDAVEAPRVVEEALADYLRLAPVPVRVEVRPWYRGLWEQAREVFLSAVLGADDTASPVRFVGEHFSRLRYRLTGPEVERFRWLGERTGRALEEAARGVRPGQTEHEVAAALNSKLLALGLLPTVTLVAADERIARYRHPIPTAKEIRESCMLVTCAKFGGLIASATRLVHFGPLPKDLRHRHDAVLKVEAEILASSLPGMTMAEIFERARRAYAEQGFPGEEERHHQGGTAGYLGREYKAEPRSQEVLHSPQAVAWNPSIAGTKSEDTYLVHEDSGQPGGAALDCLTCGDGSWPLIEVEARGRRFHRPDILVLD